MNHILTHTCAIIITVQLLNLSTVLRTDANAQLSLSDDQIPNYSHQNETDDLEPNHLFSVKSHRIKELEPDDGWSDWSEWSTCSRSCDGGVSISLRKCNHKKGCPNGSPEKYKICNMQPCPTVIDFRATQCSTYNNKAYRGILYQWLPYRDPLDPCSLTCKARVFNFVAKLAPRVEDGTRCRDGSLDMCVAGKCLSVGCDLQLGSENKVDECGICGGDGSSCKRTTYIWSETNYSPCSVSCGRGYQMSHPICIDKEAKEQVDEILCDPSTRPRPQIVECNTQKCPPFWIIEVWTPCNRKCGGGKQTRVVYCVQDVVNGTRLKVPDNSCTKQKPTTEKSCNMEECPQWFEGPWSECSSTCEGGHQTRIVVCRDVRGFYSNECSHETKPNEKQNCSTGTQCLKDSLNSNENSQEDSPRVLPFQLPWVQKFTSPSISTEPNFITGEWSSCSVSCGKGIKKRSVECKIFLEFSRTVARLPDSQCPGIKPNDFEVCVEGSCDSRVIQDESPDDDEDEDDDKDNEIITSGVENPVNKMIPLSKIGFEMNYFWKSAGFTQCTASCLGGTQESIIHCVKEKDQTVVNPYLCDINKKPDSFTRTCNDNPCPPRWNITEFGICSKECGGGVQIREVQCVHEVTRGTTNTIVVPNHQCQEPVPRSKQFCNVFDCPPQWKTESWTKCSRSCGGGVKTRKLKCIKELAFGQMIEQPPSKCPKKRPKVIKMCNSKQCRNPMLELRKVIRQSPVRVNSDKLDQNVFVQKEPKKRISLKVNGEAIVFEGTLVRLRCPRRKADKKSNHTEWFKNNVKFNARPKLQITGRNALRIKNIVFSDSGIYSCSWDNKTFYSIDLQVRHLYRSDEDKTVERPNFHFKSPEFNDHNFGKIVKNSEETDDRSHNTNKNNDYNNRDPLLMKAKPKRAYRGRKKGKKESKISAEDLYAAESPLGSPSSLLDTWEVNYGSNTKVTEIADQKIENDNTFGYFSRNKENYNENSEEKFRGQPNKEDSISQLQKLLSNMRKSKNPSNNFENTSETFSNNSLFNESVSDLIINGTKEGKIETSVDLLANTFVLGKGNPKNLKFDWMTTDWSSCTLQCGGTGFQVRASQCFVTYENVSKTIDNSLCIDAGLEMPETIRNCGIPECPVWETGQWSHCNECINLNTAIQQREVRCALNNGTILEHNKCSAEEKPIFKRECVNNICEGTWIVGDWSECNGKCGEEGFQSRIIQCVWFNTAKPAGNACKDKPRPEVLHSCLNKSCSDSKCIDKSKHCHLAKSLNMCRISHYRHQCCESCKSES